MGHVSVAHEKFFCGINWKWRGACDVLSLVVRHGRKQPPPPMPAQARCESRTARRDAPAARQQQGSGRCPQLPTCRVSGAPTGQTCLAMILPAGTSAVQSIRPVGRPPRACRLIFAPVRVRLGRHRPAAGGPERQEAIMASRSSRTRLSEAERAERRQRDRERLKQAAEQLLTSTAAGPSGEDLRPLRRRVDALLATPPRSGHRERLKPHAGRHPIQSDPSPRPPPERTREMPSREPLARTPARSTQPGHDHSG